MPPVSGIAFLDLGWIMFAVNSASPAQLICILRSNRDAGSIGNSDRCKY